MFDFIIEMIADIAEIFVDLWVNKVINSQVLKQKRRNPYKHWAAPISLYSVMGTFLK